MHREDHTWYSDALGQDMTLKVYGHAGTPVVAFPSQDGRGRDFEAGGWSMRAPGSSMRGGCGSIAVDGIDWQSWTNHAIAPRGPGAPPRRL